MSITSATTEQDEYHKYWLCARQSNKPAPSIAQGNMSLITVRWVTAKSFLTIKYGIAYNV